MMRVKASSLDDTIFSVVFWFQVRFWSRDFAKSSATIEGESRGDGLLKGETRASRC